jgi:hypothetical protein
VRRSGIQVHGVHSDPQTVITTGPSVVPKTLHASLGEKKRASQKLYV